MIFLLQSSKIQQISKSPDEIHTTLVILKRACDVSQRWNPKGQIAVLRFLVAKKSFLIKQPVSGGLKKGTQITPRQPPPMWTATASRGSSILRVGTIHILRKYIFGFLDPPLPSTHRKHVLSTENKQKLIFSTPLPSPPTSVYVRFEWYLSRSIRLAIRKETIPASMPT